MALLGSQGIVVKCSAAIFFRTYGITRSYGRKRKDRLLVGYNVFNIHFQNNALQRPKIATDNNRVDPLPLASRRPIN